jgi:RNA polymerase sigma factor (sigma-70 family)
VVKRTQELAAFCREAWPRLVGGLSLYTGDRFLAEELAQDVLVRVCERWDEVRGMDSPLGWAHQVGFNLASSHYRRRGSERRARARLHARVDIASPTVDAADALMLREAVATLSRAEREAIVLRYYEGLPVADVAALMRCPENTVKTHTRRAIAHLRESGLLDDDDLLEASDG